MTTYFGFEDWMTQVDVVMERDYMVSSRDIPDIAYYDLYEDGVSPRAAASKAVREAW